MSRIHLGIDLLQHLYTEYARAREEEDFWAGAHWVMSPGWLHEVMKLADSSGRLCYQPPGYSYATGPHGSGILFGLWVSVQPGDTWLPRVTSGQEIFTGTMLFRARPLTMLDLA